MLLDIRETIRNSKPLKYTLIALISIPFMLFGIGSYFSGRAANPVAEVDGVPISQTELERATATQRQQLAEMFGGSLPAALNNPALLRQQALDQLVTTQVLRNELEKQRFVVGDETLGRAIRSIPAFQGDDGRFDSDTYQATLRSSGLDIATFEQGFRDDTAMQQFRQGVINTAFTLPVEVQAMDALRRQQRTIDFLRLPMAEAMEAIEPSDEELQSYFEANAENYRFPERVKVRYIDLDAEKIAAGIDISDEEAQARYDETRSQYVVPEARNASHILLKVDGNEDERKAELEAIRARIDGGEDFAAVAREVSEDIGSKDMGGSLGEVSQGMMVPEFEQALFALAGEGSMSEVVQSQFGLHLIRLDSIVPERGKDFDEVKSEIKAMMKREQASAEFLDLREALNDNAFNEPESLDAAAEATGLSVEQSDWIDAESDNGPLLGAPGVLAAALTPEVLTEGNNSDLIVIGPEHELVLRVSEHEDERPKTLEDVREELRVALQRERAGEQLDQDAETALATLKSGASSLAELAAADENRELGESLVLDRQSSELDGDVVSQVFALPKPEGDTPVYAVEQATNGDRLVVILKSISVPEQAPETTESLAAPRQGNTAFGALVQALRERSKIDYEGSALAAE